MILYFQSITSMQLSEILMKLKSIAAIKLFRRHPELNAKLWGNNFCIIRYYVNTVGQFIHNFSR
jgi:REP element-mobilizing transposase RayT